MTDLTTPPATSPSPPAFYLTTISQLELSDGEADFLIEAIRTERTKLLEELKEGAPAEEHQAAIEAFGTACRLLEKLGACSSYGCETASHHSSEPHLYV